MSYSRNFGMRAFTNIVRNARFRTPAGSSYEIGAPVAIDPDTPGFMLPATAGQAPGPACGLVFFEHIQMQGIDAMLNTSADLHTVPGGRYAQIVHGAGVKVWFRNTEDKVLYDGRTQTGGHLLASSVDVSTLSPGDGLTPDGAGKFKVAATGGSADPVWLVVEQANPSTGVVEAEFTF